MTYEQRRALVNSLNEQYGGNWDSRVRDDLEIPACPVPDYDKIYFPPSYGVPRHV
ncbi:hypothetical protein AA11826_0655 [Komagataeibacter oboediens DSM 11826]|uniref:hypothetical protein n=1 Tax=Komagataeibacter oboediens TaxID=65958 RepID=UPI0015E8E7B1|nr:hypothetical protein [Komagataeibacter oboediens]GBR30522.1 hypothetical protein AA11826_0655 [Komagataeibacter oboediens DSM 11826]